MVTRYASATTAPTPGAVISRRQTGSSRTRSSSISCIRANCSRRARRAARSGRTRTARRDQLLDARLELGAADDPDLQAEVAQGAAQLAFDVEHLVLQQPTVGQQQ